MLTLSRKNGQSIDLTYQGIRLGSVTVVQSRAGKTSLAFDCVDDMQILRHEVTEATRDEIAAKHADEEPVAA